MVDYWPAESCGLLLSIVASSLNCVSAVALGVEVPAEDAWGDGESVVRWTPSAVAEPLPKKMYVPVSSSLPSSLTAVRAYGGTQAKWPYPVEAAGLVMVLWVIGAVPCWFSLSSCAGA